MQYLKFIFIIIILFSNSLLYGFGKIKGELITGIGFGLNGDIIKMEKDIANDIIVIFENGVTKNLTITHLPINLGLRLEYMIEKHIGLSGNYIYSFISQSSKFGRGYKDIKHEILMSTHHLNFDFNIHFFRYNHDPYIFFTGSGLIGSINGLPVAQEIKGFPSVDTESSLAGFGYGGGIGYAYWFRKAKACFFKYSYIDFRLKFIEHQLFLNKDIYNQENPLSINNFVFELGFGYVFEK